MTLDEAIKHAEYVASREREDWVYCIKCAEEHRQLAEWLKELKRYKETPKCNRPTKCVFCSRCGHCPHDERFIEEKENELHN